MANPTIGKVFKEWFRLARPFSLTAAAVPVFFGTALAFNDGSFAPGPFFAMLFGTLLIQAATNLFNGSDAARRGVEVAKTLGIAGSIVSGRVGTPRVLAGALM